MPPNIFSRYSFSAAIEDSAGRQILTRREAIRFERRSDNRNHLVNDGDTLYNLASRFFKRFSNRPAGLWWIIADFQPTPIHDPTIRLAAGSVIVVPSVRYVIEVVFNEGRVEEAVG